jgi:hypothetical protein
MSRITVGSGGEHSDSRFGLVRSIMSKYEHYGLCIMETVTPG